MCVVRNLAVKRVLQRLQSWLSQEFWAVVFFGRASMTGFSNFFSYLTRIVFVFDLVRRVGNFWNVKAMVFWNFFVWRRFEMLGPRASGGIF